MAISQEEINQLELLEQGIYPVRSYEFDKVLRLVDEVAYFIENAYGPDKKLSREDYAFLAGTWQAVFDCRENWERIQAEFPKLGIVGKVTLVVKAYGSLKTLLKAFKALK